VESKRSLLALSWSITTVLSASAFIMALIFVVAVETKYEAGYSNYYENYMANLDAAAADDYNDGYNDDYNDGYNDDYGGNRMRWLEDGDGSGSGSSSGSSDEEDDMDDELFYAKALVSTSSSSMAFVAVYALVLAMALGLYGSTAIVGFTSLTGRYIGPCFAFSAASKASPQPAPKPSPPVSPNVPDDDTEADESNVASMAQNPCQNVANAARNVIAGAASDSRNSRTDASMDVDHGAVAGNMHAGLFMGALLFFSNLLLICAVIFSEVRVEDYIDDREREERQPYAIEVIATVLAVLCIFLAVLYLVFAVLMFVYYEAMLEEDAEEVVDGMAGGVRASMGATGANRASLVSSMLQDRSNPRRRRRTDLDHGGGKNQPLMYDNGEIGMVDVGASATSPGVLNSSKHGFLTSGVYG